MGITDFIPIVGPLISGVSNLVSSSQNASSVRETNAANFKLAEYQNAKAVENWRMQNEYNSPTQQMQRLQDAGLNPNLIYGSGTNGATGNSSSAAQVASPARMEAYQRPMNMLSDLGGIVQGILALSQADKAKAETKNVEENTRLTQFNQVNAQLENALKGLQFAKTKEEARYWRREIATLYRIHDLTADDIESRMSFRDDYETHLADSQIGVNLQRKVNDIYELSLYDYRVDMLKSQIKAQLASANAANASAAKSRNDIYNNTRMTDAQLDKVAAEVVNIWINTDGKMINNEIDRYLLNNHNNLREGGLYGIIQKMSADFEKNREFWTSPPFKY